MSTARIIRTERVRTDSIQPHPENVRKGNLDEIKTSLQEHGLYRTIVVNARNNYILCGNHTYVAAVDLGWEEIDVNWVDADEISEKKILLVDNRTNDLSSYDNAKLAAMLEDMMIKGELQGTGYTAEDTDDLLAQMDSLATLDVDFEGDFAESAEDTAARYREPGAVVPQRQYIIMIPATEADTFDHYSDTLRKAWGIDSFRDVIREALKRCVEAV